MYESFYLENIYNEAFLHDKEIIIKNTLHVHKKNVIFWW